MREEISLGGDYTPEELIAAGAVSPITFFSLSSKEEISDLQKEYEEEYLLDWLIWAFGLEEERPIKTEIDWSV